MEKDKGLNGGFFFCHILSRYIFRFIVESFGFWAFQRAWIMGQIRIGVFQRRDQARGKSFRVKEKERKKERKKEVELFARIYLYSRTVLSGVQLKGEVVENEMGQAV
jgi:hypothetical protein